MCSSLTLTSILTISQKKNSYTFIWIISLPTQELLTLNVKWKIYDNGNHSHFAAIKMKKFVYCVCNVHSTFNRDQPHIIQLLSIFHFVCSMFFVDYCCCCFQFSSSTMISVEWNPKSKCSLDPGLLSYVFSPMFVCMSWRCATCKWTCSKVCDLWWWFSTWEMLGDKFKARTTRKTNNVNIYHCSALLRLRGINSISSFGR